MSLAPQDSGGGGLSESLARNLQRATARWQAAQGGRRQASSSARGGGPGVFDAGKGDRNLAGWRSEAGEDTAHVQLLAAEQ